MASNAVMDGDTAMGDAGSTSRSRRARTNRDAQSEHSADDSDEDVRGGRAGLAASSGGVDDSRYIQWKNNTPLLYDWLQHYNTEWPSLSIWWGRVLDGEATATHTKQQFFMSTRTSACTLLAAACSAYRRLLTPVFPQTLPWLTMGSGKGGRISSRFQTSPSLVHTCLLTVACAASTSPLRRRASASASRWCTQARSTVFALPAASRTPCSR